MVVEKSENKLEIKYSFANSDLKLMADIKTVQEKLLIDIAYNYYKKASKAKSLGSIR